MNLKKLLYWFFSTLLVGAAGSIIASIGLKITDPQVNFWGTFIFNAGAGFMFGVFSMMGFFAYLTLNLIMKGFLKRREMWAVLQWIFILIVGFDAVYLRQIHVSDGTSWFSMLLLPLIMLAGALIVAVVKKEITNKHAFTPTVFFMFVVTMIETVIALQVNEPAAVWYLLIPLFL